MEKTYVPIRPVKQPEDFNDVTGYSGGFITIFLDDGKEIMAACSCGIGTLKMMRYNIKRYDSYPATNRSDTKHSTTVAELERRKKWLTEDTESTSNQKNGSR